MRVFPLYRSFAGGEITPEMYGRIDLTKYQTGLAKALNFLILPHGPASRRPGFSFVNECRDSAHRVRLIPFQFNAEQTVILEVGHQYIRFHLNGQTLLESSKAIVSIVADTVNVNAHGYSAGDWVYIGATFYKVATTTTNSFTVTYLDSAAGAPSGTTVARVYQISTAYLEDVLFQLRYAQDSDVLTLTHPSHAAKELARLGATNWTLTDISFAPPNAAPGGVTVTAFMPDTTGQAESYDYCVTSIGADGVTESLASGSVGAVNRLRLQGNYNTISWSAVTGATRYNVYKLKGGIFGYIGSTTGLSIKDEYISADTSRTPPESVYTLNTSTDNYPAAVTYHEQRRWFAATNNDPQTIWATRTGTSSNLTSSLAVQDDDGMEFRIQARQQNAIRHLVPLSDLIALTVGGEFRVFADNSPAITPTSLSVKPQGYSGSADVQPVVASSAILYVQYQGARLREMAYDWQRQAFASSDISIMAPHLFNGYTILDMAYCRAPIPMVWCVRSDGVLLGMTYVPEQQVYAWHQHSTDGLFESVAVVAEGSEDVLYAVVKRTVDGRSVRYIERMHTRIFTDQADAFCVDCGVTYSGAPASTISNLRHLEGKTVHILADGAVHPTRVVTDGAITLDDAYSTVHIGVGYNSDFVTLPVSLEGAPAAGQGFTKNINSVAIRVTQSSLIKAGPDFDSLTEYPARNVSDPYGSPPALRTGELRFDVSPDWNSDGAICIRQDQPLPLTVMSIAADAALGG